MRVSKYSAGRYWYIYVRQTVTRFSVMFCYEINIYSILDSNTRHYHCICLLQRVRYFDILNFAQKVKITPPNVGQIQIIRTYIFHTWLGEINVQDRKVNKREKTETKKPKNLCIVQLLA